MSLLVPPDASALTITGGTQIGGFTGPFSVITQYTGQATLSSGTHTADLVLTDYGSATGALIGKSVFYRRALLNLRWSHLHSRGALPYLRDFSFCAIAPEKIWPH